MLRQDIEHLTGNMNFILNVKREKKEHIKEHVLFCLGLISVLKREKNLTQNRVNFNYLYILLKNENKINWVKMVEICKRYLKQLREF